MLSVAADLLLRESEYVKLSLRKEVSTPLSQTLSLSWNLLLQSLPEGERKGECMMCVASAMLLSEKHTEGAHTEG